MQGWIGSDSEGLTASSNPRYPAPQVPPTNVARLSPDNVERRKRFLLSKPSTPLIHFFPTFGFAALAAATEPSVLWATEWHISVHVFVLRL